jgi:hypothetical protein
MPDDPDVIYKRIQNMLPSRYLLKETRKDVDLAYSNECVHKALNKFYVALLDEQDLATKCVSYAH